MSYDVAKRAINRIIYGIAANSEVADRTIIYEPNTEDQAREAMSQAGMALAQPERLIGFYRLVRQGLCEAIRPDLTSILRREPTSFAQFARDYSQHWNTK